MVVIILYGHGRPMLRPATVVDFPVLRTLIREGAATGSIDRRLASDSREANLFFANLRQALATGYFVDEDPETGDLATIAAPGYVYLPDGRDGVHRPIGFGLFKAAAIGYELWLAGIDEAWRGQGHGRAMLAALFKTPLGQKTYVIRVTARGEASAAFEHLLRSFGFSCAHQTPESALYLRHDAPGDIDPRLRAPPAPHLVR